MISKISKRDKKAFEDFYRAMERPLYGFIFLKLNDSHQASDLLHDVFIEVWKGAGRFEGRSSVKTWVFGIAYRKVIDVYRRSGRVETMADVPEMADESPTAEETLVSSERATHVRACIEELKPDHRVAIELAFFEDFSYRQISDVVGSPEGTVKTRVYHAKKLLLRCVTARLKLGVV